MSAKHLHLSFLSLMALLGATILLSAYPATIFSHIWTYFFSTSKSLIILFVFMKVKKAGARSWLFFILALLMVSILVTLALDDVLFRDNLPRADVYGY